MKKILIILCCIILAALIIYYFVLYEGEPVYQGTLVRLMPDRFLNHI